MTHAALETVIEKQAILIVALDAGRIEAIGKAAADLSDALMVLRGPGAWHQDKDCAARLDFALRQTEAASTRVKTLADWNRQRLDRLAAARGGSAGQTYDARGKSRLTMALR